MHEHICDAGCNHGLSADAEPEISEEFKVARRSFLRDVMVAGGSAATVGALGVSMAPSAFAQSAQAGSNMASHYFIPASSN
ncbi:MAG: acetamidase, partial [Burkholderiales bacterium]